MRTRECARGCVWRLCVCACMRACMRVCVRAREDRMCTCVRACMRAFATDLGISRVCQVAHINIMTSST